MEESEDSILLSSQKKWMKAKLRVRHFERVAETAKVFHDYIGCLRGKKGESAQRAEIRDDEYDPDQPSVYRNYGPRPRGGRNRSSAILSALQTEQLSYGSSYEGLRARQ